MTDGTQTIFRGYAEEISNELKRSQIGSHLFVEYTDLLTLREMYSYYTKSALHNDNEIVVILPFYETKDKVREILSEDSACIDVRKYEKEQRLLIMDSLKGYFGLVDGLMPFVKQTVDYAKASGRRNVTVMSDMGSFFYYDKKNDLVGYEMQLCRKFDMKLKGICLYHIHDFERLPNSDRQKFYQYHSRVMHLLPSPIEIE
ncbi:MAG TPA: MEDS domain-containing protein [Nitrososphaeraceae archaeon]